MNPRHLLPTALLALLLALAAPQAASAGSTLTIRGAGWGHGVGMSQWGAYGMAREGFGHARILRHYYTGTQLGTTDPDRPVRVLLRSRRKVSFTGASRIAGRRLNPSTTYSVRTSGSRIRLLSPSGRTLARYSGPARVSGPAGLRSAGRSYRGVLDLRVGSEGVNVINVVDLEQYVRGVVALESPPSWPLEALKAQSVAARTYAITTSKSGNGFDQYADTRSQVYGGMSAETPSTDRAVAATRGRVVTYGGRPVVTYFFSTSGGRTEDVENVWPASGASPWLRSVDDPYDKASPRHRWQPVRMSLRGAERKLRGLVRGDLRGIEVVRRGSSPRIVAADVVGTRGDTRVSGATLRSRLGLHDTWAYFTTLTAREARPPRRSRALATLAGTLVPSSTGTRVRVQRRVNGRWRSAGRPRVNSRGSYRKTITRSGLYRVRKGGAIGPQVRIS